MKGGLTAYFRPVKRPAATEDPASGDASSSEKRTKLSQDEEMIRATPAVEATTSDTERLAPTPSTSGRSGIAADTAGAAITSVLTETAVNQVIELKRGTLTESRSSEVMTIDFEYA